MASDKVRGYKHIKQKPGWYRHGPEHRLARYGIKTKDEDEELKPKKRYFPTPIVDYVKPRTPIKPAYLEKISGVSSMSSYDTKGRSKFGVASTNDAYVLRDTYMEHLSNIQEESANSLQDGEITNEEYDRISEIVYIGRNAIHRACRDTRPQFIDDSIQYMSEVNRSASDAIAFPERTQEFLDLASRE
jgi:hypothetical protein